MKNTVMDKTLKITLDGKSMQTKKELFCEIERKLSLPQSLGRNWDALDKCLQSLDWLCQDEIEIILVNKECILTKDSSDEIFVFYSCMTDAAEWWKNTRTRKVQFINL